jgi:phage-related baseplate assembly protein
MLGVERLGEKAAQIIVQFTLQEPIGVPMMVPQGTRVTADSTTFFATDDIAVIDPGLTTVTVTATCITMGAAGNGFVVGQVNRLVDPLPFVVNVTNTTVSSGGLDVETDDALRARINLAPESFSTAGSELSYVFWALSARQDISDVSVVSPTPGIVNVYVLLEGGTIPPAGGTEIQDVTDAVSALNRRPLTDMVTVRAPTAVNLDYRLTWYITQSQVTQSAQIEAQIKQAVADYEAWQIEKIGRDINPDRLIELCRAAGAKRIDTSLYFQRLDATQVVQFITNPFRIAFGAVEDE